MNNKLFIYFLFISLAVTSLQVHSAPKKVFYIMGGGGEPEGSKTTFDEDLEMLAKFTNSSDWESTISFNGGHQNTEKIIKNKMSKSKVVGTFNEKNYQALINEMISKLETGELKQDDQLMIEINSHGDRKRDNVKTHDVALSGYSESGYFGQPSPASLDSMQKLIDLAAEKGVKLAIMDMSCYSGNLLNLKNEKACLISSTSADTYAFGSNSGFFSSGPNNFIGSFHNQFKKGKNLEEIFLQGRAVGSNPDFPRISTGTAEAVEKILYDYIAPFLTYNLKPNVSLFYSRDLDKFEAQVCAMNATYNNLDEIFFMYNEIAKISDKVFSNEFSAFKKAITDYRKSQLEYEDIYRSKLQINKEIGDILEKDFSAESKLWGYYEPMSFMMIDESTNIKLLEEKIKNNQDVKFVQDKLETAKKRKKIIDEISNRLSESSKSKLAKAHTMSSLEFDTFTLAAKVSIEAKKMYNNLYKSLMDKDKANPCKDFVL